VFGEDTPLAAVQTIRPQVFVEGGDYVGMEIAEADVMATWGGRLVVLPLVAGRSTTRMIDRCKGRHDARPGSAEAEPSLTRAGRRPA
jgi:bifunctional ADP-heptose synthase (sugar kinase/adenylyltransferase)